MAVTIRETALRLDQMIADKAATIELAELLASVQSLGKGQLALLAILSKNSAAMLDIERARQWPVEHAAALGEFIRQMPYVALPESTPCGKKELFIDEALQDATVPKAVRIQLWRMFVQDGYKFPCYAKGQEWTVPKALYDHPSVRSWLCQTKQVGWEELRCSDPQFFSNDLMKQFKTDAEKQALEFIEKDSPAGLLMPLDIDGRSLPTKYAQAALMKKAIKIITLLFSNNKVFKRLLSPQQLLFYVCANWNNDETIPFVTLLEKENPGLVKNSLDAFGHDALWYTLYQRDCFGYATLAARRKMTPLDKTLIKLGCDPKRQNFIGLSYEDLTVSEEVIAN